jgi:CDP-6-deoxy-D-xylo-4-hexulose-3-dehydrase
MVCTDDEELMRTMTSIAWWGRDCYCIGSANLLSCGSCGNRFDNWLENYNGVVDHKYVFTNIGYNLKPLDLQGAIGIIQLGKFGEIESKRVYAKQRIEKIFTENIPNLRSPIVLDKAETCWFGTPFICSEPELKRKLVKHLEDNKVQTRNYFAGNILLHEGYKFLGNYEEYVEANKVLDDVFFIGASPHYGEETFEYIEKVVKDFRYD